MRYPLPRRIAHRGGGSLAPENTLAGIRLAAALGFRAVEFDVMLSADGVPVLIHDETLERTTDGSGRVSERTHAELSQLDAGSAFHPAWAGERIPGLDEALALCAGLGLAVNVEIKPAAGHEALTGEVVASRLAAGWPAGIPLLLSSFSETALAAARRTAPALPRALLSKSLMVDWRQRLAALGAGALHLDAAWLTPRQAAEIVAARIPFALYTLNSPETAERWDGLGAAASFTDRLDLFAPAAASAIRA